jgi:hypothetical protein
MTQTPSLMLTGAEILQSLGIIPRSPSPSPDTALTVQRNNEMMMAMQQELVELRVSRLNCV